MSGRAAAQLALWAPVPPSLREVGSPALRVVSRSASPAALPAIVPGASPHPASRAAPGGAIATGVPDLDRFLGGGLPRGEVVEVAGGPSSGKSTFALGVCLRVLADGGRAAWIDPGRGFWPLAALEAGAPVDRLVVVHPPDAAAAYRAADILLHAPGVVDLVVVDLAGGALPGEARVTRLRRLAGRGGAVLLFLDGRPGAPPALGATVGLRLRARRRVDAPGLEVVVVRHKRGPDGRAFLSSTHDPDRLRLDSTV